MYYVLCAAIAAFIILTLISLNKKLWAGMLLLVVAVVMIMFPSDALGAAKEGMNLWLFVVVPSLLPFFILNDMMISMDVPKNISYVFSPVARLLFNSTGYGAYAFIMSIFSGYPSGAKITATLIKSNQITPEEGQRILSYSSTSGPLFIIGAVGSGMLKSPAAGYLLFISHILGAMANGVMYNILSPKANKSKTVVISPLSSTNFDPSQMLGSSISSSLVTCGFIGGYIVLFSVIIKLLNKIQFFSLPLLIRIGNGALSLLIQGCLEISSGSSIIASSALTMSLKLLLLSFILGFGGISILGQVSTVVSGTGIKTSKYITFKVTQGIFSSVLCFLLLKVNVFPAQVFLAYPSTIFKKQGFLWLAPVIIFEALLLVLMLLNLTGYAIRHCSSRESR